MSYVKLEKQVFALQNVSEQISRFSAQHTVKKNQNIMKDLSKQLEKEKENQKNKIKENEKIINIWKQRKREVDSCEAKIKQLDDSFQEMDIKDKKYRNDLTYLLEQETNHLVRV